MTPICYPDRMISFNYFSTRTGTSSMEVAFLKLIAPQACRKEQQFTRELVVT